jgi:hypothetical protein
MKIKMMIRKPCHIFLPRIRMGKIQSTDNTNAGKGVGLQRLSFIARVSVKWHSHIEREIGSFYF